MTTPTLTKADLIGFNGTEDYFIHGAGRLFLTEGVKFLADRGGAHWLLDAIASYQSDPRVAGNTMLRGIQFWRLTVAGGKGVLTCREDSGREPVVTQVIEYTDFPLDEAEVWVERGGVPTGDGWMPALIAMLPSER